MTTAAADEPRWGRPIRYEVLMECPHCLARNRLSLPDAAAWRAVFECYGCNREFVMPPKRQRKETS